MIRVLGIVVGAAVGAFGGWPAVGFYVLGLAMASAVWVRVILDGKG